MRRPRALGMVDWGWGNARIEEKGAGVLRVGIV